MRTSSGEFLAGVLTDDPTGMQYLDGLRTSAYSSVSLAAMLLDETTLEDTRAGLDMLDLLLVQDFDTDRLRTEQKEAIKRWVRDGGVLVQGGRQKAADVAGTEPEIEHYGAAGIVTYPCSLGTERRGTVRYRSVWADAFAEIVFPGSSWRKQIQG